MVIPTDPPEVSECACRAPYQDCGYPYCRLGWKDAPYSVWWWLCGLFNRQ